MTFEEHDGADDLENGWGAEESKGEWDVLAGNRVGVIEHVVAEQDGSNEDGDNEHEVA